MSRFEPPAWRERAFHAASTCSFALAPWVVLQGRRVRRLTPRLPEAAGPRDGEIAGADPPIRLLLIGESTAAGVGVATHDEGLAGEVSRTLAAATDRRVVWMVRGRNGATAESTRVELLPQIDGFLPDVTVVVLGVNDTLRLARPRRFIAALDALATALRARQPSTTLVIAAVPPMGRFPALPAPLRQVLGLRARVLDLAAVRFARGCAGARHVPMPMPGTGTTTALFAADGFHPSAPGYQTWGRELGEACAAVLAGQGAGPPAARGRFEV
jgi:lysophospholipase L1-like esterase